MLEKIKRTAEEEIDGAKPQCYVLFILTHGERVNNEQVVLGTDGRHLTKLQIINKLDNCDNLRGVPRLVFFQCCRGSTIKVLFFISHIMCVRME